MVSPRFSKGTKTVEVSLPSVANGTTVETNNPRPHKKLKVWQKAIELVTEIYKTTERFPRKEDFGLSTQMRRAAVSVPSNIAEGLTRKTNKDKLHFLNMAQASLSEIDTQIEISLRLGFINQQVFENVEIKVIEVEKLLSGLSRSIE
ncbi:MAG: four helix bundle protein [Ignavibacteriales bacterium]|nr:four helix bundle protein [Ignavibacteriales bacterium]